MSYDFERHQNCPHFCQNSWMMSEGKYECAKNPDKIFFLDEIPQNCIKGFKAFQYRSPLKQELDKIIQQKQKAKIYKFKIKEQQ